MWRYQNHHDGNTISPILYISYIVASYIMWYGWTFLTNVLRIAVNRCSVLLKKHNWYCEVHFGSLIVMQYRNRLKTVFHDVNLILATFITPWIKSRLRPLNDKQMKNNVHNCPLGSSLTRHLHTSRISVLYGVAKAHCHHEIQQVFYHNCQIWEARGRPLVLKIASVLKYSADLISLVVHRKTKRELLFLHERPWISPSM